MMNDCARTAYDALAAAEGRSTSRRRFVVMLGNDRERWGTLEMLPMWR